MYFILRRLTYIKRISNNLKESFVVLDILIIWYQFKPKMHTQPSTSLRFAIKIYFSTEFQMSPIFSVPRNKLATSSHNNVLNQVQLIHGKQLVTISDYDFFQSLKKENYWCKQLDLIEEYGPFILGIATIISWIIRINITIQYFNIKLLNLYEQTKKIIAYPVTRINRKYSFFYKNYHKTFFSVEMGMTIQEFRTWSVSADRKIKRNSRDNVMWISEWWSVAKRLIILYCQVSSTAVSLLIDGVFLPR